MPFWLLMLCLILLVAANLAINALWIRLASRVLRGPRVSFGRAAGIALIWGISAGVGLWWMSVRPESAAVWGLICGILVPLVLLHFALKLSILRTLGAFAMVLALSSIVGLAGALAIKRFWLEAYIIKSPAMAPSLPAECRVLFDKTLRPQRWDAIAFRSLSDGKTVYASRIIGLPGETVEIVDGGITINNTPEPAPAALAAIRYDGEKRVNRICRGGAGSPITLGPGEFYVLGDNSTMAMDSRYWTESAPGHQPGVLTPRDIIGVARIRCAPLDAITVYR